VVEENVGPEDALPPLRAQRVVQHQRQLPDPEGLYDRPEEAPEEDIEPPLAVRKEPVVA
jgi:hypothetical protein